MKPEQGYDFRLDVKFGHGELIHIPRLVAEGQEEWSVVTPMCSRDAKTESLGGGPLPR